MPKIRDLGINVIPDMTRPPEVGFGGGCGCTCTAITIQGYQQGCGATDPCSANYAAACPAASNVTCVGTGYAANYEGYTCGATRVTCSDWAGLFTCGATRVTCEQTGAFPPTCGATRITCSGFAAAIFTCGATRNPSDQCFPSQGGLTREAVSQLKAQLQQYMNQLDEYAKSIGPKTAEEIDAREKELQAELEDLARRRKDLGS